MLIVNTGIFHIEIHFQKKTTLVSEINVICQRMQHTVENTSGNSSRQFQIRISLYQLEIKQSNFGFFNTCCLRHMFDQAFVNYVFGNK